MEPQQSLQQRGAGFRRTCVAGEDKDIALHVHQRRVPLQQRLRGGDVGGCDTQGGIHGCRGNGFGQSGARRDWAANWKGFLWPCLDARVHVPVEELLLSYLESKACIALLLGLVFHCFLDA